MTQLGRGRRIVGRSLPSLMAAVLCGVTALSSAAEIPAPQQQAGRQDAPADLEGQASGIREAATLLAEQLGLQVFLAEPIPGPSAEGRAVATPPPGPAHVGAPPRHFSYRQRPLREVLDGVCGAFGYTWKETRGAYVITQRTEAALEALAPDLKRTAEQAAAPPRADLEKALAGLAGAPNARTGISAAGLPDETRRLLLQAVRRALATELESGTRALGEQLAALRAVRSVPFEEFSRTARVFAALDPATGQGSLRLRFAVPGQAPTDYNIAWSGGMFAPGGGPGAPGGRP